MAPVFKLLKKQGTPCTPCPPTALNSNRIEMALALDEVLMDGDQAAQLPRFSKWMSLKCLTNFGQNTKLIFNMVNLLEMTY